MHKHFLAPPSQSLEFPVSYLVTFCPSFSSVFWRQHWRQLQCWKSESTRSNDPEFLLVLRRDNWIHALFLQLPQVSTSRRSARAAAAGASPSKLRSSKKEEIPAEAADTADTAAAGAREAAGAVCCGSSCRAASAAPSTGAPRRPSAGSATNPSPPSASSRWLLRYLYADLKSIQKKMQKRCLTIVDDTRISLHYYGSRRLSNIPVNSASTSQTTTLGYYCYVCVSLSARYAGAQLAIFVLLRLSGAIESLSDCLIEVVTLQ